MKRLNEIFEDPQIKNLPGAINRSKDYVRGYNREQEPPTVRNNTSGGVPPVSRFKCKVYFLDGNARVFYSYDNKNTINNGIIKDEWNGVMKLFRLIDTWEGRYKTVIIWSNLDKVPLTQGGKYDYQILKRTRYVNELIDISFLPSGEMDTSREKTKLAKQWELSQRK